MLKKIEPKTIYQSQRKNVEEVLVILRGCEQTKDTKQAIKAYQKLLSENE